MICAKEETKLEEERKTCTKNVSSKTPFLVLVLEQFSQVLRTTHIQMQFRNRVKKLRKDFKSLNLKRSQRLSKVLLVY